MDKKFIKAFKPTWHKIIAAIAFYLLAATVLPVIPIQISIVCVTTPCDPISSFTSIYEIVVNGITNYSGVVWGGLIFILLIFYVVICLIAQSTENFLARRLPPVDEKIKEEYFNNKK